MPAASKYSANADNFWMYFLAVFAASPRCVCTNSKVLPYRVGACGRQRQTAFLEVPGEAQPFVKMLVDDVIRVAQFQQPASNLVHALLVR